jgi:hypothetical protein
MPIPAPTISAAPPRHSVGRLVRLPSRETLLAIVDRRCSELGSLLDDRDRHFIALIVEGITTSQIGAVWGLQTASAGQVRHKINQKLSAEMDRWEREQQKKHTRDKRIRRDVRRLIREVRESEPNER